MADSSVTAHDSEPFDVVSKYHSLLSSDPDLTPPIAAIESLIAVLTSSPATTISETLNLLSHSSMTLRASITNWIALSAGTDLFQRYLVQTLNRPSALGTGGDFGHLRQHFLSNGRLFVQRAKKARAKIAKEGRLFIREGSTVLTNGDSRVVSALLLHAAEGCHFRVIYVSSSPSPSTRPSPPPPDHEPQTKPNPFINALRSRSIPVAEVPYSALAVCLQMIDLVLVGAEGVVENGGIISRLGTYQIGLLARSAGKPMYVATESYKFVRLNPLGMGDLPIQQKIFSFEPDFSEEEKQNQNHHQRQQEEKGGKEEEEEEEEEDDDEEQHIQEPSMPVGTNDENALGGYIQASPEKRDSRNQKKSTTTTRLEDAVDFTPPDLISALITENGVLTPSAVSEELIKLWF